MDGMGCVGCSHYSELKIYALSTPHVENASCEFDVDSLSPTYNLLIGIPGKSNAFAISKRLGLRDDIIEAAKGQITEEKENFEDVISDLENSRKVIEKERGEIAEYKARIKSLQDALERKQDKMDDARDKILREAHEEARDILKEAKEVADETIRTFQKAGPGASMKDLEKARDKVRGKINNSNEKLALKEEKPQKELKAKDLRLGDDVKIISMGLKGTVSTLPDEKGDLFVQCGILRSKTNIKDLILIPDEPVLQTKKTGRSGSGASKIKMSKSYSVSGEINLIGKTTDEAIYELDKYLDDAYLAHLPSVRIVHGKGTGALRNAVSNKLKRTSYVKSYRAGEYGEGDAGVTICEFKE